MSGLKSTEHGVLGEARAKAFLLERFWVLERSVDAQGADYLIQRRLTDRNFMDRSPPKLGIIQVKYVQDGNTYLSIFKDYVCNEYGLPYTEFFLLLFTGRESNSRSFLLSSNDLLSLSTEKEESGRKKLNLKSSLVLDSSNNEILNHTLALDRIDHALKNADFIVNREFLGTNSYLKISQDQIDHDLLLPLDSQYGNLGREFFYEKGKLQSKLFQAEEIVEAMKVMLRATDPEESFRIYEEKLSDYVGSGRGIIIDVNFFDNEDFQSAVQSHKKRLEAIRNLGVEAKFFELLEKIEVEVARSISKLEFHDGIKVRITVSYDKVTLRHSKITVEEVVFEEKAPFVNSSQLGRHVVDFSPCDWISLNSSSSSSDTKLDADNIEYSIRKVSWKFRRPLQKEIEKYLIGEELASSW